MNFEELLQAAEMNAGAAWAGTIDPAMGMFLAGFAGVWIVALILAILMIVARCFLFRKMGNKWYEALVSGHNLYVLIEKSGRPGRWIFAPLVMIIPIPVIAQIAGIVLSILVWISVSLGIAKRFGKWTWFGVGLILLPFIFYPILARGKAQYINIR